MRGIKELMIACHLHVSFEEHAVHFSAVYGILMNTEKTGAYNLYSAEPEPLGRHCCLFFLPSSPSVHQRCWEYPLMMDHVQRSKNKRPNGSFKADLQRVELSLVAYLIPRAPRKAGWLPWASGVCSDLRHCWNRVCSWRWDRKQPARATRRDVRSSQHHRADNDNVSTYNLASFSKISWDSEPPDFVDNW